MNVKVALACVAMLALNAVACGKSGESSASETKAPETKVDMNAAKEMYESRCSSCHGVSGKGDGPGAAALNPKPRNFADSAWNKSIKDDQLRRTIIYGGAAVGKSPIMPASPDLDAKPEVVDGLIKMVRSFGGHLTLRRQRKKEERMKPWAVAPLCVLLLCGCDQANSGQTSSSAASGQAPVQAAKPAETKAEEARTYDPTNIVTIAAGSKDHTTLVAALKAADYVESVGNPGPFTVFAPTNAAFDKIPKAALDELLKPEKKEDLRNVLKNHVAVSVYQPKALKDGMTLAAANGGKLKFAVKDGKITVNGANIVASIPASNGIVHVVDAVLLPESK